MHPSGYYLPKLRRRLSAREAGRLQGWPPKLLDKLLTRFEPQQVGGALGDGMSINVLSKVLLAALVAIGELSAEEGRARDLWSTDNPMLSAAAADKAMQSTQDV